MSSDLPQRFRDLAQQHQAVLEHWSVFWERVNARNRNHVPVWEAWRRFEKAFVDAALAVAELKAAVPPEVANLWIGPTGLVAVYCGYLRVGEALEAQAKFFQTWLPRVAGATDLHWIWDTDFHRYMERFEQDQWELRKAAEACEVWYRKQEVEAIARALEQSTIRENDKEPPKPEASGTETTPSPPEGKPETSAGEPPEFKVIKTYFRVATPATAERIRAIIQSGASANEKLNEINSILPIPLSVTSAKLAELLGVAESTIRQTDFWKRFRQSSGFKRRLKNPRGWPRNVPLPEWWSDMALGFNITRAKAQECQECSFPVVVLVTFDILNEWRL
uniref:hypothetical protein n=1 Tax=Thermogutta sp. TaxID=1962930 RepID=UPI00321FC7CE